MSRRRRPPAHRPPALSVLLIALACTIVLIGLLYAPRRGRQDRLRVRDLRGDEAVIETSFPAGAAVSSRPGAEQRQGGRVQGADEAEGKRPAREEAHPDMRLLSTVRDKTRVIPKGAYFHLVELAMKVRPQVLETRLAISNPPLVQLVRNPDAFRGKPVRLDGYVRRVTPIDPGPNDLGVRVLYECAVFSDEYDLNPWIFVVLHVPRAMPTGDGLRERVTATGYFLKLWAYQAGDGMRFAPLLIGPRLVWHPAPSRTGLGALEPVLLVLLLLLVLTFGLVLWWSARTRPPRRQPEPAAIEPAQDAGPPEEFLGKLAEGAVDEEPRADRVS